MSIFSFIPQGNEKVNNQFYNVHVVFFFFFFFFSVRPQGNEKNQQSILKWINCFNQWSCRKTNEHKENYIIRIYRSF